MSSKGTSADADRAVVNGAASVSAVPASIPSAGAEIWRAGLDGKYQCAVTRLSPSLGELTISEGGKVLASAVVSFSYSAMFGPDVADVATWEEWCAAWVDGEPSNLRPAKAIEAGTAMTAGHGPQDESAAP